MYYSINLNEIGLKHFLPQTLFWSKNWSEVGDVKAYIRNIGFQ